MSAFGCKRIDLLRCECLLMTHSGHPTEPYRRPDAWVAASINSNKPRTAARNFRRRVRPRAGGHRLQEAQRALSLWPSRTCIKGQNPRLLIRKLTPLPPRPNAIDAPVCIAAGIVPDCRARHRTRPQHDAGPSDATLRIINVLAVHDCASWWCTESDGCKSQQNADRNPCNCH